LPELSERQRSSCGVHAEAAKKRLAQRECRVGVVEIDGAPLLDGICDVDVPTPRPS